MQIRRLRLQNFRQHADTVLVLDRGLTGVVGPNGSGKTTLLEAIAWAMYGMPAARGSRETIRRRGAPPRSRVEVELEFDLGSHRYRLVRTLQNAELYQDHDAAPVANSLGAVTERITRLLGMSREEFFNTYFTGQKELAFMAAMSAPERAQFLSRVLGYERLRTAQQRLRDRRKAAQGALEAREAELVDLRELEAAEQRAAEKLTAAEAAAARLAAALQAAEAALATVRPEAERWEQLQQRVVSLEGDLKVALHGAEAARETFSRLDRELAEALSARSRLDELLPRLQPLESLRAERESLDGRREAAAARKATEARLAEVKKQLARTDQRLAQLPPSADGAAVAAALEAAAGMLAHATREAETQRTAWVRDRQDAETQRKLLLEQHQDLREQRARLEERGPDGVCPTCNRPLGAEFRNVLDDLGRQIEDVELNGKYYRQRIEQLQAEPAELLQAEQERPSRESEVARLTAEQARIEQAASERSRLETEKAALAARAAELAASMSGAAEGYDEARHREVRRRITELEPVSVQAAALRATAERAADLGPRAVAAEQELSGREATARRLREELAALGWSTEAFERARAALREAELAVRNAEVGRARAAGELTAALGLRAEVQRRREERERQAAEVRRLRDELLLFQELDRSLGDLRTDLNNTLRPDLSDLASGFLRDLTAGRYTDLELDEEYVATVIDEGEPKSVISGGEEDVANLALRLAISQMIAERAGQPLSLLVLDEIFGSLDEEHRGAVLSLLRQLADRFPQVILITHIETVREGFDRVLRVSYDVERGTARVVDESPAKPPVEARHAAA
ncbi:MAG: AAA family ATPase [Gemmatimonadales bacterium]